MLLDLRGFRGGFEDISREMPAEAFAQEGDDFRVAAPVSLTARATKDAQKIRLTGRVRTTLETDCGRCLESYAIPVDAPFDLMFLPEAEAVAKRGGEQEMHDADAGVAHYKDDVIDLSAVAREQFILALPMKPLCREDCRGLCPTCGINRNRETCDCREEWTDPRLAPLKNLFNS